METAKEKAIRYAWIEIVGEDNFTKLRLNEKGYSDWYCKRLAIKGKIDDLESITKYPHNSGNDMLYRPRKLSGIENNNGWILFEGSINIPTKECNYALGKFVRGAFRHIEGQNLMRAKHALVSMQYTHYREQHNYPTPIY